MDQTPPTRLIWQTRPRKLDRLGDPSFFLCCKGRLAGNPAVEWEQCAMRLMWWVAVVRLALCRHSEVAAGAQLFPSGSGEQMMELKAERLTVFTYRPGCLEPSLLIVLHGKGRNADQYRDWARPLADQHCFL